MLSPSKLETRAEVHLSGNSRIGSSFVSAPKTVLESIPSATRAVMRVAASQVGEADEGFPVGLLFPVGEGI